MIMTEPQEPKTSHEMFARGKLGSKWDEGLAENDDTSGRCIHCFCCGSFVVLRLSALEYVLAKRSDFRIRVLNEKLYVVMSTA